MTPQFLVMEFDDAKAIENNCFLGRFAGVWCRIGFMGRLQAQFEAGTVGRARRALP
jgi:hypothetical protein